MGRISLLHRLQGIPDQLAIRIFPEVSSSQSDPFDIPSFPFQQHNQGDLGGRYGIMSLLKGLPDLRQPLLPLVPDEREKPKIAGFHTSVIFIHPRSKGKIMNFRIEFGSNMDV